MKIQNDDEQCYGYAVLIFIERLQLSDRNFQCNRAYLFTNEMFYRHNLDTLLYPISLNNVHLYEDLLQMNINVFFSFDDEGRARHPFGNL